MKKVLVVAALMFSSVATFAQHAVGSFNLQPKVGVSIANLTDNNSSDARVGLVAGVEGEIPGKRHLLCQRRRTLFDAGC